jgi:hypothetical protein
MVDTFIAVSLGDSLIGLLVADSLGVVFIL